MPDQAAQALVLFGPPGSGKGTQAKLLMQCLGVPHISTGDMLRERIQAGDSMGQALSGVMRSGALVDDDKVNALVEDRLAQPDASNGFILDGYPRTRQQAEALCAWLKARGIDELVIHLLVDYNSVIARLTGRRQCPLCGTLYNLNSKRPKVDEICDLDGTKLVIRDDDSAEVIQQRLKAYEQQTRPLIEYFLEKGRRLLEVDASSDPPQEVMRKICRAIREEARV
jgi:adenylate kinase